MPLIYFLQALAEPTSYQAVRTAARTDSTARPLIVLALIGLSNFTWPLVVAAARQPIAQAQTADEAATRQAIIAEVGQRIGTNNPIEVKDLYINGDYGIANWNRGESGG